MLVIITGFSRDWCSFVVTHSQFAYSFFVICPIFFILNTYFQYVGKNVSCTSSNQKEGKLAFYSEGDVKAYLANPSDASKLGEKKPLKDGVSWSLDNCERDTC